MAMAYTVTTNGLGGAVDLLKKLPDKITEQLLRDAQRAALIVQREVRLQIQGGSLGRSTGPHVRRGKLAQSWQTSAPQKLGGGEVRVSVGSGLIYARIHETGGAVRARNAKALTIPLTAAAARRPARSFPDTFLLKFGANAFIVMKKGKKLEFLYVLKKQVQMPRRRYVSNAIDQARPQFAPLILRGLDAAIKGSGA